MSTAINVSAVPLIRLGTPYAPAASAFSPLTKVPRGHLAFQVDPYGLSPWVKPGEFCVVDPRNKEPVDGAVYAIQWSKEGRVSFLMTRWQNAFRNGYAWWVRSPGGGLSDGPYNAETMKSKIIGRVIGVLADDSGRHLEPLWGGSGSVTRHADRSIAAGDLPDKYVCSVEGTCMEPLYRTNDRLLFSQLERPRAGDAVGLWRKPELHKPGFYQVLVKRLVSALPKRALPIEASDDPARPGPVIIVEMLNPPQRFVVKLDEPLGVHKCEGQYAGPRWRPSPEETRALAAQQRQGRLGTER